MLIKETLKNKKGAISFEVFPPKRNGNLENVLSCVKRLALLKPCFISVTYGASGEGNRDYTIDVAEYISKCGVNPLAHLTAFDENEQTIEKTLNEMSARGIHSILALRGDMPQDYSNESQEKRKFEYASDLIAFIRKNNKPFELAGAFYPEGHIECDSLEVDLHNLQIKIDAGVDFLISQLFFENALYFDYLDLLKKKNINIPVIAGIMPVLNPKQIIRILSLCNAKFPHKFARIISRFENSPEALFDAGIAFATEQIIDLLAADVDGIHIYTMNRPEVAERIIDNIKHIIT